MTTYLKPRSLNEALHARAAHPDFLVLAGGTDALVGAQKRSAPQGVVDLWGLAELAGVNQESDGALRIGAATTYSEIIANGVVQDELPLLVACAREVGALQIQARGTIGGNIATSSPVGDTLPLWLALDAELELASAKGRRILPYHAFLTGYRTIALKPDEIIAAVRIPPRAPGLRTTFRKVGTRRAQAISKVMMAGTASVIEGAIGHVRLAFGAVADRPVRVLDAERAAIGLGPRDAANAVRAAILKEIHPIDDLRSRADYRRTVAANLAARFIGELASR